MATSKKKVFTTTLAKDRMEVVFQRSDDLHNNLVGEKIEANVASMINRNLNTQMKVTGMQLKLLAFA